MKKYILMASDLTDTSEKELIAYFRENKVAWWHHVPNAWLLTSKDENVGISEIHAAVKELRPTGSTMLLLEVTSHGWAGTYPVGKNPFLWLKKVWKRDKNSRELPDGDDQSGN